MKIYEYVIRIKDQASDKLRRLQATGNTAMNGLRSFGSHVKAVGSDLFNLGGLAGAAARILGPAVLGLALLSTGKQAIMLASDLEQMQVGFEVMLGSAQKANDLIKDIRNEAKFTPFETTDLVKSAEILLGFGVAGEKIMPTLQMLGDTARGNSEKLRLMALAYAQVQAAGRLMGQDLLQMINAGFNPLQEISKNTGIKMTVLKKKMEDGAISAQMVTDAFKSATSQGGRFYQMSEKQSKTFAGTMSTLRDEYREFLTDIGTRMLPTAIKAVAELRGTLNELITRVDFTPMTSAWKDFVEAIRRPFSEFFDKLGISIERIDVLQFMVNSLAGTFRLLTTPIRVIASGLLILVDAAKSLFDVLKGVGLTMQGIFMHDFTVFKVGMSMVGKEFAEGYNNLKKQVTDFGKNEFQGWKDIVTTKPKGASEMAGRKTYQDISSQGSGDANGKMKAGLDKISGGGKQHVNVTINLENLIGTQNFDVKNIKESMRDVEKQVVEALLRVVNSAQYAASQ